MDEFTSKKLIKDMDYVKKTLANMDKNIALTQQDVSVHIKRTDLLEKHVQLVEQKLEPIEKHVDLVSTIFKFVAWIGASGLLVLAAQQWLLR